MCVSSDAFPDTKTGLNSLKVDAGRYPFSFMSRWTTTLSETSMFAVVCREIDFILIALMKFKSIVGRAVSLVDRSFS